MPNNEHPRKTSSFKQGFSLVGAVSVTTERRDPSLLSLRDPSRRHSSLLEHSRVTEGKRQRHMGLCHSSLKQRLSLSLEFH